MHRLLIPIDFPRPGYGNFVADPLSIWIESTVGLRTEDGTGRLVRARPRSIAGKEGAAAELSALTGVTETQCSAAIQQGLLGATFAQPDTGFPTFAFRITSLSAVATRRTRRSSRNRVGTSLSRASSSSQAIAAPFCSHSSSAASAAGVLLGSNDGRCRKRPASLHAERLLDLQTDGTERRVFFMSSTDEACPPSRMRC